MDVRPSAAPSATAAARSRLGRGLAHTENGRQQEEPAEDVRAGEPVEVDGGEQRRGQRAGDQKITARGPVQPEPEPDGGGYRQGVEGCDASESGSSVKQAGEDVRAPFPGDPGRAGRGERVGVGGGQGAGGENAFAGDDVPARVGVTEQGRRASEEEEDIQQRDQSRGEREVGRQKAREARGWSGGPR